jgi:hypothetical protein
MMLAAAAHKSHMRQQQQQQQQGEGALEGYRCLEYLLGRGSEPVVPQLHQVAVCKHRAESGIPDAGFGTGGDSPERRTHETSVELSTRYG